MSFSERKKRLKHIIDEVGEEYREAAFWLPFQAAEIKEVFSASELDAVEEFITDMEESTDDNKRAAKLINRGTKYAKTAVKLLKLAKVLV